MTPEELRDLAALRRERLDGRNNATTRIFDDCANEIERLQKELDEIRVLLWCTVRGIAINERVSLFRDDIEKFPGKDHAGLVITNDESTGDITLHAKAI